MIRLPHFTTIVLISSLLGCVFVEPASSAACEAPDSADVLVKGAQSKDKLGNQFALGDFDGDGYEDLAIHAYGASPLGRQGAGIVHILWGPATPGELDLAVSPGSVIIPPAGSDGFFASSGGLTAGDFNGDDIDDLALGIPCEIPGYFCDGKVIICFGQTVFPDSVDLDAPMVATSWIEDVSGTEGYLGMALAAGDLDGDGTDDLVAAAPVRSPGGRIYVVYGRSVFPPAIQLGAPSPDITLILEPEWDWGTGESLDIGDVNDDGYDDLLFGSPGDAEWTAHGKAGLVYGGARSDTLRIDANEPRVMRIYADPSQPAKFGGAVGIGDVDGDGWVELAIAADNHDLDDCTDCGLIYVVHGRPSFPDSIRVNDPGVGVTYIVGADHFNQFGSQLCVGDLSGDGLAEIVIANRPTPTGDSAIVAVVSGTSTPPDTIFLVSDTLLAWICGSNDDAFGHGLAVGDLDSDGYMDLLAGAWRADPFGRVDAGMAYAWFGAGWASAVSRRPPPFKMLPTYPNPFSSETRIRLLLPEASGVHVDVFDVAGRRVGRTLKLRLSSGEHEIVLSPNDLRGGALASGVYFVRVKAGLYSQTAKLVLVR